MYYYSEIIKNAETYKFILFEYICALLKLYIVIPISIPGTERLFSLLKLIKTNSRNRLCSELLSNLNMIGMHKNIAAQLSIDNVIDEFPKTKCRLSFVN